MFRTALFTLVSATTISSGATHAFHTLQSSAMQVSGVYAAAEQILDVNANDYGALNAANEKLYAAGAKLQPLADYAASGEVPAY